MPILSWHYKISGIQRLDPRCAGEQHHATLEGSPMTDLVKDLENKAAQIEEQLQLVVKEYPDRIALDRLKFAMSLTRFMRTQLHINAAEQRLGEDPDDTVISIL
jgi:hypothetical protein